MPNGEGIQSTLRITTLGGASEKCLYSQSVIIAEVSLYVLQLDGTLLWAWKFCRYSRTVVTSSVVISKVDRKSHNDWNKGSSTAGKTLPSRT